MSDNGNQTFTKGMTRRQSLGLAGGVGAGLLLGGKAAGALAPIGADVEEAQAATCTIAPRLTEGPFWEDERLNRSNIVGDRTGVPLSLAITVVRADDGCTPAEGVWVDIWHCDKAGNYSDEPAGQGNDNTLGQTWLRGYQVTNAKGVANFTSVYPGWYGGRAVHIHVRIRAFSGSAATHDYTTQIFFPDATNSAVVTVANGYDTSGATTTNGTDGIYAQGGSNTLLIPLSGSNSAGYTGSATVALSGLPASGNVDAELKKAKWVRKGNGNRALRLSIEGTEQVAVDARIKRGKKTVAKKKVGALSPGKRTIDVVVPDKADGGGAKLAVTLTDQGGNKKSATRKVKLPNA